MFMKPITEINKFDLSDIDPIKTKEDGNLAFKNHVENVRIRPKIDRKSLIRVGDRVKITNPEIFQRVGYPNTKEDIIRNEIKKEDIPYIEQFMNHFGLAIVHIKNIFHKPDEDIFDRIVDAIAYGILRKKGYGGNARQIYTKYQEIYKNKEFVVTGRRVVNTGTYVHGGFEHDYDGCPEYTPAYLSHQKSHIIYKLEPLTLDFSYDPTFIEIEKIHLQKI